MAGIVGYGAFVPRNRIKSEEIARQWGKDPEVVRRGLLLQEKSVPGLDEDTITISVEAGRAALERAGVDPQRVGALQQRSEQGEARGQGSHAVGGPAGGAQGRAAGWAGAQALAVTMRGLFLREITLRHLPRVLSKEAATGLMNGFAVAATTALGVWIWSRSPGLALILAIAMVVSMIIAGIAGALVPMLLERFGQDPATASSIILTTVTDCTGFFSFLGTATLLSALLT